MPKRFAPLLIAFAIAGCRAERAVRLDAPLGAARRVRIELTRADVRITPANGNRIVVTGRIRRESRLVDVADDLLAKAGLEITNEYGVAIVRENAITRRLEALGGNDDRPLLFDLDIAVPPLPLSVEQSAGKVTVSGDFPALRTGLGAGQVNIRTSARSLGRIDVQGAAGEVVLKLPHDHERQPLLLGGFTRDLGGSRTIDARLGAGQIIVENVQ